MSLTRFVGPTCMETVSGIIVDLSKPTVNDFNIDDIAWGLSRINRFTGHTMSPMPYSVAQHTVMVSRYCEWALTAGNEYYDLFQQFIKNRMANLMDAEIEAEDRDWQMNAWETLKSFILECPLGVRNQIALHGLAHDFAEAYLTDVPSPVKRLPGMYEAIRAAEANVEPVIFEAIGLDYMHVMPNVAEMANVIVHWADMLALKIEAYHMMASRGLSWNLPQEALTPRILQSFRPPVSPLVARDELLERYNELKP